MVIRVETSIGEYHFTNEQEFCEFMLSTIRTFKTASVKVTWDRAKKSDNERLAEVIFGIEKI